MARTTKKAPTKKAARPEIKTSAAEIKRELEAKRAEQKATKAEKARANRPSIESYREDMARIAAALPASIEAAKTPNDFLLISREANKIFARSIRIAKGEIKA